MCIILLQSCINSHFAIRNTLHLRAHNAINPLVIYIIVHYIALFRMILYYAFNIRLFICGTVLFSFNRDIHHSLYLSHHIVLNHLLNMLNIVSLYNKT